MYINEASDYFKKLIIETSEKSETRIYHKFVAILSDLENKELTDEQLQSLEKELDNLTLDVTSENRKKHFKQKLNLFEKYLKENFSLISEGYYTGIGMSLGLCFGVAFGAAFKDVSFGLIFGMLLGLAIGASLDLKAKKEGKVLKTKLD